MKSSPRYRLFASGATRSERRQARRTVRRWLVRFVLSLLLGLSLLADSGRPREADSPDVAFAAGTFTVNSFADEVDDIGNSLCQTASNVCTLRAAIQEANASGGATTINLPGGIYLLTLTDEIGEDAAATGDLDITGSVNITVVGMDSTTPTVIDGNNSDRIFEVFNSASLMVDGVMIQHGGNSAGGILLRDTAQLTLKNSTLANNNGGGLTNLSSSSNINLVNSTVSANNSTSGGGIYTEAGIIKLSNVTITGNSGSQSGGGIRNNGGAVLMKNSILAGNPSPSGSPDCVGSIDSQGFNLVGNNTGCTFNSGSNDQIGTGASLVNPRLDPLANNGGRAHTHALQSNSPAINAGNNQPDCKDQAGVALTSDQRGTIRPQGGRCDIGAYEVPAVKFQDPAYSVSEVGPTAAITVTLDDISAYTVTVGYTTTNGTAIAGSDYVTTTGTLTFAPFDKTEAFTVPIMNDATFEGNETVNLALGSLVGATPGSPFTAVLTITSDDPPPTVRFSSSAYTVTEASTAAITVTLSPPSESMARVNYATSNGTAIAGSDYTTATGTLTFAPLETSRVISVTILHDSADEPDETFTVMIDNPLSATIAGAVPVTVTILDDDLPGVYMPIVMRTYSKFFTGFEVEPNNNTAQANGPLGSGLSITGNFNDARDYYHFTSGAGTITVNLTSVTASGIQLQLFYQTTSNLVTYDPTPPFSIQVTGRPAGKYIIIVYKDLNQPGNNTTYNLSVTYPP